MTTASGISLSARNAAYGAVLAAPPAITAAAVDAAAGLALAVGMLPSCATGLRPTRAERVRVLVVGAVASLALFSGSLVAGVPPLAVLLIAALSILVALWASRSRGRIAPLALALGLPLYGAGLSFGAVADGLTAAALIMGGCAYSAGVSLIWSVRPAATPTTRHAGSHPGGTAMISYGAQIGVAGAAAAAIGFALGVDHPGWACAAALLVSRPQRDRLDARARERVVAVTAGALVACGWAALSPPAWGVALLIVVLLAAGAAVAGSRWYVFPFFSTTLVLSLLLARDSERPAHWFIERAAMTLVGVGLALGAAWLFARVGKPTISQQ